jgi:hypothetical protein
VFCKYFFVLFVSFVVKIESGCPLHASGAPAVEDLGQLEKSAYPGFDNFHPFDRWVKTTDFIP